jgi:hypothetical protein
MRNIVKITFVLLLSFLLAGEQSVFSASAGAPPTSGCACSGGRRACCAARQAPASKPVAPARTVSSERSSLFVAALSRILALAPSAPAEISTAYSAAPSLAAAFPLYQRNCSYLI